MPLVYVINLALPVMLSILFIGTGRRPDKKLLGPTRKERWFTYICVIQMTLIAGTRTLTTGTDTENYFSIFLTAVRLGYAYTEILFNEIMFFVGNIFGANIQSFMIFNIVIAFLTLFFLALAFYRSSMNIYMSMYLFVASHMFYQMLNQVRQNLAMAITLFAITYLQEKKRIYFIFWTVIAAQFHKSAYIVLSMLFIDNIPINRRTIIQYFILAFSSFFLVKLVYVIVSYTPYSWYLESRFSHTLDEKTLSVVSLVITASLPIMSLYCYPSLSEISSQLEKRKLDIIYHMVFLHILMYMLGINNSIFRRLEAYFFYGYYLLIPLIGERYPKTRTGKTILILLIYAYFALYHLGLYIRHGGMKAYNSYLF